MLRVDLRDLQRGPVKTVGEVPANDPTFEGLNLALAEPVAVRGELQRVSGGGEDYLWRGEIHSVLSGECRRCLTAVQQPIDVTVDAAVFSSDPDAADDPGYYRLAPRATHIDLSQVVREELVLGTVDIPFVLCKEDCAGLCPKCGADLNAGPCPCGTPA